MTLAHIAAELFFAAVIVGAFVSIYRDIRAGMRVVTGSMPSAAPPACPSAGSATDAVRPERDGINMEVEA
jgi:hypothetical protein